ncbi:MAG TPA: glycosyltransferase family 4 protein [Ktedonobacteraceae bacterium]|nr:glycosyltransferase family 4 protein [Ktedonobacteraceae bacterium]
MGNRLRICFICFMFAPIIGGAEARAEKQARQLQALGHEVTILTLRHDKGWKAVDSLDGLRVIRIGGLFRRTGRLRVGRLGHFPIDIALLRTLWRLRHSFDIIHVFQISSLAAVAAFIGKLTGIPVIISTQCAAPTPEQVESMARGATLLADTLTHADYLQVSMHNVVTDDVTYLPRSALGGGAMLRFLRNADAYYQALSTRSQSYLAEQGFRLDHIVRISGSVNTEKFRPAPERRPDARQPERLLLCVARLEYSKGVDVLLHAWGRMMREGAIGYQGAMNCAPTIVGARDREGAPIHFEQFKPCLLLVGEGVLRTQLERMVEELGIGESVKFLGMRTDVIDLLQQAWGFVLPSRWEGMPNALLEAMACGLPCVATSVSGSEDILVDGVNGLLVPPEQPVEMAQALRRLIANEELAQRLGREARATVVRDYQLTTIVEQCLELYRHVLSRRSVLAQVGSRRSDPLWSLALRTGTRATTRDRPYENHIPTRVGSQGTSRGYPDGVNRSNNE